MRRLPASTLFFLLFVPVAAAFAQTKTTDYLGAGATLSFQSKNYNLAWSSHPTAAYYKQEYVQKGDSLARFQSMLLLEVLNGSSNLTNLVTAKVNELKALKATNPLVQYEVFSNAQTGEYLLDFLLTATAPDGSTAVAERNVYRYKTVKGKEGRAGVLLFGVSVRSYGAEITAFLNGLKTSKKVLVNEVAKFRLPQVSVE